MSQIFIELSNNERFLIAEILRQFVNAGNFDQGRPGPTRVASMKFTIPELVELPYLLRKFETAAPRPKVQVVCGGLEVRMEAAAAPCTYHPHPEKEVKP